MVVILSNAQERCTCTPPPPSPLKTSLLIWSSHQQIKADHPKVVLDEEEGGYERRQDIKRSRETEREREGEGETERAGRIERY